MKDIPSLEELLVHHLAELEAINEKFYELGCRHRHNADKLSDGLNRAIEKAMEFAYEQQLKIQKEKIQDTADTLLYIRKEIHSHATPKKKVRWYWPWSYKRWGASRAIDDKIAGAEVREKDKNDLTDEVLANVEELVAEYTQHNEQDEPGEEPEEQAPEAQEPEEEPEEQAPKETWEEEGDEEEEESEENDAVSDESIENPA